METAVHTVEPCSAKQALPQSNKTRSLQELFERPSGCLVMVSSVGVTNVVEALGEKVKAAYH